MIYGYLKVFPDDLGTFDAEPTTVIARLNQAKQYGYGTWRLPTKEELDLMRANNAVGSGNYMTCENKNTRGTVRLVTDKEKGDTIPTKLVASADYVDLGLPSGTLWKSENEEELCDYDMAVKIYGDKLPTEGQLEELQYLCQWTWIGNGYKVTGPNDNSIFLPAAGERYCDGRVKYVNYDGSSPIGVYWSSTPFNSEQAWVLIFGKKRVDTNAYAQCYGFSVRLVQN